MKKTYIAPAAQIDWMEAEDLLSVSISDVLYDGDYGIELSDDEAVVGEESDVRSLLQEW